MSTGAPGLPWNGLTIAGEQAFVLALARAYALGENPEETRSILATIVPSITSWERVNDLLRIHRCRALSYAVLRDPVIRDAAIVPETFFIQKREWYGSSFTRMVLEPTTLHRVNDAFVQAGIPALAIKGLALGSWLYRDPALREHDDLDFLVPEIHINQLDDALRQLGYTSGYRPPLYPGEAPGTASYVGPHEGITIDLSFDPLYVFGQSTQERQATFDGWWQRRQSIVIGGHSIPSPGPEDQFIQLARHFQFHGYFRVNWAVDVLLLLRLHGERLNWDLIGAEAARLRITGGLSRTLELLSSVYGLAIPEAALKVLCPSRAVSVLHRRIWPDRLAIPRERPLREQEGAPIIPRFLTPRGVHPLAGLSLFLLDEQRTTYLRYFIQRVAPPRSWLRTTYGAGSYPHLLQEHWRALRALRERVQRRTKR